MTRRAAAAAIALAVFCACGRVRRDPDAQGAEVPPSATREVQISFGGDPAERQEVRVGDVLRVVSPDRERRWQVDYASDVLTPLTAQADMAQPPEGVWRFRAARAGESELRVSAVIDPSDGGRPAPLQFSVSVRVVP